MTSIGFTAEERSIFGQGQRVEIDLCEHCLRDSLGEWLRVSTQADAEIRANSADLSAFDPNRHGGEFPAGDLEGLDEVFRSLAVADAEEAGAEMPVTAPDIDRPSVSLGQSVSVEPERMHLNRNHGAPIMKLWTTTVEYSATGEGETLMAWIGHAEDAAEAKAELIKVFNSFHGAFGVSVEGVARNSVTELLFSEEALRQIERLECKATVRAHAMIHVNRS